MAYTPKQITEAFDAAEDEFGEHKSTEFLAAITADRLGIDIGSVMHGLFKQATRDALSSSTSTAAEG